MKIAIYGITGAGKDFLINKTLKSLILNFFNILVSNQLYILSIEKFGKNFK